MVKSITDPYEVAPLARPPHATVKVPGSKSITNRALILAALAKPDAHIVPVVLKSVLENALRSDDTLVMIEALRQLGISIHTDWENNRIEVDCLPLSRWRAGSSSAQGIKGLSTDEVGCLLFWIARFSQFFSLSDKMHEPLELFCGNSGTSIRFLTALLALGHGRYRLDGVPRMRERPIGDLLHALQQLGVDIISEKGNGCPPVILRASGLPGGNITVRGDVSSQFLSALLMVAPLAQQPLAIQLEGPLVSVPYVLMTLKMMQTWGARVPMNLDAFDVRETAWWNNRLLEIPTETYRPRSYTIEPDASSASYFWAAAAITGGTVTVPGLTTSMQGDAAFVHALVLMGCEQPDGATVQGKPLRGIEIDMNAISDTVMTLAVVALFAEGSTRITNVAHIRHKETDRLAALATELRKVGAGIDEHEDGLTIHPRPMNGATLDTYEDHRMAMSLALIGLRIPGIRIKNPACTAKTYPVYWQDLENLRQ